jgi:hypothetical protein
VIDPNEGIVRISQTLVLAMQFSKTRAETHLSRGCTTDAARSTRPPGSGGARRAGGPHALPETTRAGLADEDGAGGRSFKTEQ